MGETEGRKASVLDLFTCIVLISAQVAIRVVHHSYISTCTYRQKQIEENMRNMQQMVADYRKKVYELRHKTRQKKQRSDEETYLIATGKMKEEPHWQALKTNKKTK